MTFANSQLHPYVFMDECIYMYMIAHMEKINKRI